jgi:DNA-binding MarR family transcriptional regulator
VGAQRKARRAAKDSATDYLNPMHSIGYLSRLNFRMFARALEQLTLPHGVSGGQWRSLRVLWETDGLTQKELSERVGIKEATIVYTVRSLINAGLAQRVRCTDDRRKFYISLTPKARRLRTQLMPKVQTVNELAVEGIDPKDVAIARRVMAQTCANLQKHLEASER